VAVPPPEVTVEVPGEAAAYGDLLLGLVERGRDRGIDAEAALRAAARRYAERVRAAETRDA
jgi:XTP/dITP diphosphohydrolase